MDRLPMDSCRGTATKFLQPPTEGPSVPKIAPPRKIDLKQLINKINYIHFLDGTITACFCHKLYDTTLSLLIKPQPCTDEKLICHWDEPADLKQKLKSHQFKHLLVNDGQKALLVKPTTFEINSSGLFFSLPDTSSELNSRQFQRHYATGITAQLIQNGSSFEGVLVEFSAKSLQIKVKANPPQTFQWLNPDASATLLLIRNGETIYSSDCIIFKQSRGQDIRSIVLNPKNNHIVKFKSRKHRSARQYLTPSPSVNFRHPLTGKWTDLAVSDISGSGLSITESAHESALLPGLLIPDLTITFANSDSLYCKAQVVYRIPTDNSQDSESVKCGIAFLDMRIEDQARLLAILYQADNKRSYLSNRVDLDCLWKFFFDSGFIYPEKYLHLKSNKDAFKKTYKTLYEKRPNIARHFVYQDNGEILAHMSMIRFYRTAWLVQHHAAKKSETRRGGLSVLSQISRYANEAYRLYSAHLDFLFCYFRPENKFPRRIFGGVCKHIDNPKGCSIDSFAYFHFNRSFNDQWNDKQPWSFHKSSAEDLQELNDFIEFNSGGLMVPALDLDATQSEKDNLTNEYQAIGLKREHHLFSLKINGNLNAIIVLNISEVMLNLSDLTNCFKIFVVNAEDLTKEILFRLLSMLCFKFHLDQVPVLMYPSNFAESINIPIDKIYNLWILNMQNLDGYFDFCTKMIRNFSNATTV